ncbi:hypothetical protein GOP47_0017535 [Adiantum capillus-veneris]|uniref:Uncharacterized protein n=1 Tax=Adiantum capillus-veneris TaxID=13818 RepID=A0A9D4UFZ7_ADICA|nr:hypothetical protein GOP47_0017535 [Adiantum capillus-veneris]
MPREFQPVYNGAPFKLSKILSPPLPLLWKWKIRIWEQSTLNSNGGKPLGTSARSPFLVQNPRVINNKNKDTRKGKMKDQSFDTWQQPKKVFTLKQRPILMQLECHLSHSWSDFDFATFDLYHESLDRSP